MGTVFIFHVAFPNTPGSARRSGPRIPTRDAGPTDTRGTGLRHQTDIDNGEILAKVLHVEIRELGLFLALVRPREKRGPHLGHGTKKAMVRE